MRANTFGIKEVRKQQQEKKVKNKKKHKTSFLASTIEDINIFDEETYYYVFDTIKNYFKLLNKPFQFNITNSYNNDMMNLINELNVALDNNMHCVIDVNNRYENKKVLLYNITKWEEYSFFWMPTKWITEIEDKEFQYLAFTFMKHFIESQKMMTINESRIFEVIESDLEHAKEKDENDYGFQKEVYGDYVTDGKIYNFINSLKEKTYDNNIVEKILNHKPKNKYKKIHNILVEGLQFISNDPETFNNSIFNYYYDYYYDDSCTYENNVHAEEIIMICYDNSGSFEEMMSKDVNSYIEYSYSLLPCENVEITPNTKELFTPSTYLQEFNNWAINFINELS